jgi:hypothetical protein
LSGEKVNRRGLLKIRRGLATAAAIINGYVVENKRSGGERGILRGVDSNGLQ